VRHRGSRLEERCPGRARTGSRRRLLWHQSWLRLGRGRSALREPSQRLLAAVACGRVHASPARAGGAVALIALGFGLTNAAYRTTRGSSELRRSDFAGSASRLEQLALALRPGLIAFVGKEAYRGAFGRRPEHGLQTERLAETALFVLPSTSPANAAVSWDERLRWFRALRRLIR
jgi:TDG/mug DNA glycosylase family protein